MTISRPVRLTGTQDKELVSLIVSLRGLGTGTPTSRDWNAGMPGGEP